MPRKHPTGVMVMTTGEFFASEAAAEGKGRSGGDLMNEYLDEMEADMQRHAAELMGDSEGLLGLLKAFDEGCEEEDRLGIESIITMLDAGVSSSVRSTAGLIIAIARLADAREVALCYEWSHFFGSFYDPPENDENVVVLSDEELLGCLRDRVASSDAPWLDESLEKAREFVEKKSA